jgi:glyoxylase-like metal-dependent hydrolase (beta-lactamase superfamily II)
MRTSLLALLGSTALLAACTDSAAPDKDTSANADTQTETTTPTRPSLADTATAEAEARTNPGPPSLDSITDPQLTTERLGDSMDVLFGRGGNVAVLYGEEGALLVDDKFADNAQEILARVAVRSGDSPVYVLNTHYHGDHTGSNAAMKAVGATIIAHRGTQDLMSRDIENQLFGRTSEARDAADHPDMTFSSEMSLKFGGETVQLIHTPSAHTGGDSIIHFVDSDVIHMGDNYFNGMFPYIDIDSGGSLEGMIAAHGTALRMSGEGTTIIPGHGPITDAAGLKDAQDLLLTVRDRMQTRIDAGDSLEDVIAADIYADFGLNDGFINNENMTKIAYRSLSE